MQGRKMDGWMDGLKEEGRRCVSVFLFVFAQYEGEILRIYE